MIAQIPVHDPSRPVRWTAASILRIIIVALVVALGAAPGLAWADDQPYDVATCEGCHKGLKKKKQVHPALDAITCADCHAKSDSAGKCKSPLAKGWKLKSAEPGLCRDCHPQDEKQTKLHPVIDGMGCTPCHDAHGSDVPHLLKAATIGELCSTCHDGVADFPHPHTPVKKGQCTDCHDPHASAEPHLLKVKQDALCGKCHKAEKLLPNRTKHAPVSEGACTSCHGFHGAKFPHDTLAEPNDLCSKCHDRDGDPQRVPKPSRDAPQPAKPAGSARDANAPGGPKAPRGRMRIDLKKDAVHGALDAGGCVACHVPGHSSAMPKLLKKRPVELCYECHDRQDGKPFVHSAVRLGDCAVCHEPHASDTKPMLRKAKTADTCFLCHADDATGRDVVHKPLAEGKCDACHAPHGADHEFSLTRGTGKLLCGSCHKPVDTGKNRHAVLDRGGCVACHDPHATDNPFLLPKPVNALCAGCHPNQKDGTHVTSFIAKGHKISGGPDPHDIDRDFSCASCHNPHGSDSPKLLRFGDNTMEVCDWCHGDRMGKHPELKDISKRKRSDKNAAEYRKAVSSSLHAPAAAKPQPRDAGAADAPVSIPDALPASHD